MLNAPPSPVNVVWHLKCTPDQIDLRSWFDQNFHHVEPIRHARVIQQPEPLLCAAHDSILLRSSHSRVRRSEGVGGTGFYFDEDKGCFASITANQIDFAASFRSEIPVKYPETVATKVIRGHFLTSAAERQVVGANSLANHLGPES